MSTDHTDTGRGEESAAGTEEVVAAVPPEPLAAEAEPVEVEPKAEAEESAHGSAEDAADEPAAEASPAEAHSDEMLSELAGRVETLTCAVEEANRLSGERERIIDRLHQENQQLRQGELQQAVLPVFRDLVRLYDDLRQTAVAYTSRAEVTPADAARDFGVFAEMVADILYRQGVERYEAHAGDAFSTKEHRVLGAVQTPEQAKDRTIARSVRDGFRSETRVVRLLEAEVYRYVPQPAAGGEGVAEDAGGRPQTDSSAEGK